MNFGGRLQFFEWPEVPEMALSGHFILAPNDLRRTPMM
jgi:hypothetical protein